MGPCCRVEDIKNMEPNDFVWLLEGLDESQEHLRNLKVSGEQRKIQVAWAFYRVEAAAAAIRGSLEDHLKQQAAMSSLEEDCRVVDLVRKNKG